MVQVDLEKDVKDPEPKAAAKSYTRDEKKNK